MNSIREYKLAHKLTLSVIAAFLISAALFLILQNTVHRMIRSYCAKPEVISVHLQKKADSLQQYIRDNGISLSELLRLEGWMDKEDLTEVAIYRDSMLLYSSHTAFPRLPMKNGPQNGSFSWQNGYTLAFPDGEAVTFINDLFEHRYIDYATYLNLVVFFLCFITIMIFLIHKKVSYINTLEQEIRVLEGGNLNYAITVKGNDELASLAKEIDEMRKAFISREQYADRVRAASSELMTGISHDLRTPLTALIGYLEVLEEEDLPAGQSPFLQKCKNRAFQIKGLINNLFEYFVVSANTDEQIHLSTCTAREALEEIIKDHVFLLEQKGYLVINRIKLPVMTLKINCGMVQRVFDNLLSNICRYADPVHPVQLKNAVESHELVLTIDNQVLDSPEIPQRTELGLKTCEKIMSLHHGRLIYGQQGSVYTVQLVFPLL